MKKPIHNYHYNRLLALFHKLQFRLNRSFLTGRFKELSKQQQSRLLQRLEKLRTQLARIENGVKYGSIALATTVGLSLNPTETIAQFAPAGSEFQVNTYTTAKQTSQSIAMDSDGDFVVTWASRGQDTPTEYGIYAQRYNAQGAAIGSEFLVNTHIADRQYQPVVAMDDNGNFVIAWTSSEQDGNWGGVYFQRFNASGIAQGSETQVNTTTTGNQYAPAIAMDSDGDFVITWAGPDQNSYGIYGRRYDPSGAAKGGEFQVNTYTTTTQRFPSIAMDNDGDFVITWQSEQDGSDYGIYGKRYNTNGVAQGSEFRVNTYTAWAQQNSSVAMDGDGDFVVTWQSSGNQDGSNDGIYAQRYNAAGVAQGAEFRANTYTTGNQQSPAVAMGNDGGFVITWQSADQDGNLLGIYAQRYNAAGSAQEAEFLTNTYTTNDQKVPAIAIDNDGDFTITWISVNQDGNSDGIFAQKYEENFVPTAIAISSASSNENVPANATIGTFTTTDRDNNNTFTYTLVAGTGDIHNSSFTITGDKLQINASPDFEAQDAYMIRVRVTDQGGLFFERFIIITIFNVNEAPTDITLNNTSVAENIAANTEIGTFVSSDQDAGNTFTYSFAAGTGDTDNASFTIVGDKVQIKISPNFEVKNSYSIRVRSEDQDGLSFEKALTITITNVNEAPSNMILSTASVAENVAANAEVGTFSATDPDAGNTFTYTLISGTGSTDNAAFTISDNKLQIKASPDFETKSSYSIRVRCTDQGALNFVKVFTITVTDENEVPTDITLSASVIAENVTANTEVGTFTTTDQDAANTFTYSLVAGTGDADNASFTITDDKLQINASPDFETKNNYSIRVSATDQDGLSFEKVFTITVTDENEAPSDITLSVSSIDEGVPANTEVATLSAEDEDGAGTFTFAFVSGTGDDDNASFTIVDDKLQISESPDFETKSSYTIRVSATDDNGLSIEKILVITINDVTETGISEANTFSASIQLYPNPAKGTVQMNLEGTIQVRMMDLSGHVVKQDWVSNKMINIEGIPSGIYMLEFTQNDKTGWKKLVIE